MKFKYTSGQTIDPKHHYIDLKSDTVTKPTPEMLDYMRQAQVGDDVYHEDPTVTELESYLANLTGKESALFLPSGTQSNLVAVLSHCNRGDEILIGDQNHINTAEGAGVSVYGGVAISPLLTNKAGGITKEQVARAIKPNDWHCANTKLVCLENTVSGLVQPQNQLDEICDFAHGKGLSTHLDGARLFNAHVHTGLSLKQLTAKFDSVSICLSKGLGSPIGSVLVASDEIIRKAERIRKNLGGGLRQAGFMAACGLYALKNNINCLQNDHDNARKLADGLKKINQIEVIYPDNQTNMVFFNCDERHATPLKEFLFKEDIIIGDVGQNSRLVCHLGINSDDIDLVVKAFIDYFA